MEIAVLIKQVPDTYTERRLRSSDWTLDREATDAVIDEIDSRGVEIALQLTDTHGGKVTIVTIGAERANEALRKALAMEAHEAVHVLDDALGQASSVTPVILVDCAIIDAPQDIQPSCADCVVAIARNIHG